MAKKPSEDPAVWISYGIRDYVDHAPENHLQDPDRERAFDTPLVGFAAGDDPLFEAYKDHVGPFHWTPEEVFGQTFPDDPATAGALTVIAWILPQTRATKADNRRAGRFPAERWARSRTFGEEFNARLRRHAVDLLQAAGIAAVAPMLSPDWERRESPKYGYASTWSERHAAYACGLGTFGLSDGLITPLGKAMRVGSVVARIRIQPSHRPYETHQAYCLFHAQGVCGKCIQRCPAGAITAAGHDKVKCKAYIRQTAMPYIRTRYGFEGKGCGLCQTKVPCESRIPVREDQSGTKASSA
jgi:epoxyqueuosine reductase QueG